jgi:hypothetical protein
MGCVAGEWRPNFFTLQAAQFWVGGETPKLQTEIMIMCRLIRAASQFMRAEQ